MLFYLIAAAQSNPLQHYILENTKELNANAGDFKGLTFLDTLLINKRIVFLGESSHGTEEYSQVKLQIIEYLHKNNGFNVVLFESPMTPGSYFNLSKDSISADSLSRNCIQPIWHTATILRLFEFMKANKIYFGGFDPQFIPSPYSGRVFSFAFNKYPEIKKDLLGLENRINEAFPSGINSKLKDSISAAYVRIKTRLENLNLSSLQKLIQHIIIVNISYYANLYKGNERDSCMAKNLIWLAEQMYPNEKIIVWAHNSHIDKNSTSSARFMGKVLSDHFGSNMYVIGLYMVNGNTALNNRSIITVEKPLKNSLEDLLSDRGFKTAFIETKDEVFDDDIKTYHWGRDKQKLNLSKSFDAVILVNGVSPPDYLKN